MYCYQKQFLSVDQLIKKFEDAGMEIDKPNEAKEALLSVGYYRLKGYCFHWYDKSTHQYKAGTSFSKLIKLYHFDVELSHLIFSYLSEIEVAIRARLVNAFQLNYNILALNDPSNFDDKKLYWKNQSAVASEIARSNEVFIKHNFINHEGAVPLWATVEVMSFGTLSKIISTLKVENNCVFSELAKHYKYYSQNKNYVVPSKKMLTSWIQAVSNLRNICAHNSRIYNRSITVHPEIIAIDKITPAPRYNGLYQLMLTMKYLRPTDDSWNDFTEKFDKLLEDYLGVYEIKRMNFPEDWQKHFQI